MLTTKHVANFCLFRWAFFQPGFQTKKRCKPKKGHRQTAQITDSWTQINARYVEISLPFCLLGEVEKCHFWPFLFRIVTTRSFADMSVPPHSTTLEQTPPKWQNYKVRVKARMFKNRFLETVILTKNSSSHQTAIVRNTCSRKEGNRKRCSPPPLADPTIFSLCFTSLVLPILPI